MSRNLSTETLKALYSSETEEVFLILLTIDHESLGNPIRVTSDAVETVSLGHTFVPFPFEIILPDELENRAPRAQLTIENVSREILVTLKPLSTPPKITMEIIRAVDSNTIEAVFPDFILKNIKYNALTLQGDLSIEGFTAEPYPATIFSPSKFPSLF